MSKFQINYSGPDPDRSYADQQLRYQATIARQLENAVASSQGLPNAHLQRVRGDPTQGAAEPLVAVMDRFQFCPFAISAVRLKTPVRLQQLRPDKIKRLPIWEAMTLLVQSDRSFAGYLVVFDHHGDDLADLVLHTGSMMFASKPDWQIHLNVDDTPFVIDEWKKLLPLVAKHVRV